ncbi:MAG: FtsW/RodA/SpoVE family cell cycle protein [bacterium]|nr:FtsW/RodA/SpoVE family cell cycle protein [bacterium]
MPMKQQVDRLLLGSAVLLTSVGLAILVSASWPIATERYGRAGSYFFSWQTMTAFMGLAVMVIIMHFKVTHLTSKQLVYPALIGSWVLLILIFFQPPIANTHRWLSFGGISFQPSVLARLALLLFASRELALARVENWPMRRLLVLCGAGAITAGLVVAEPDLGTSALMLVTLAAMALVAGIPMKLFSAPAAAAVVCLAAAVLTSPYRLERVRAFFGTTSISSSGWQGYQSLVSIGSGGLLGRGYGEGLQKLFFLPEPHTDFIFAITGEELGLAGMAVLFGLAAVITWRGMRIAARQETANLAILAFGLSFAFAAQTLIHVLVCLDLLPPKGIPLPLVSYGKTDLLISLTSIGMLLGLSREVGP